MKKFILIVLAFLTLPAAAARDLRTVETPPAAVAQAGSVYDMLTPEMVSMYEQYISEQPVVSDIRPARLERMADNLDVSVKKLTVMLIVKDLASRTGVTLDIKQLAPYSEAQMIREAVKYGNAYADTLSPERKALLKSKIKEIKHGL